MPRTPWTSDRSESRQDLHGATGEPLSVVVERHAFGVGGRRRIEVGRVRPRLVETQVDGRRVVLKVPVESDPWVRAFLGVLIVWGASAAILAAARRLKERARGIS